MANLLLSAVLATLTTVLATGVAQAPAHDSSGKLPSGYDDACWREWSGDTPVSIGTRYFGG